MAFSFEDLFRVDYLAPAFASGGTFTKQKKLDTYALLTANSLHAIVIVSKKNLLDTVKKKPK